MSTVTNCQEVKVGSQQVTVREMTVLQVRNIIQDATKNKPFDVVNELFMTDCNLEDIKRMTNLDDQQLNDMLPSEIREVLAVCKEMNPDFFGMVARIRALGQSNLLAS